MTGAEPLANALVARSIAEAVHDPLREAWRRAEAETWTPVREALADGIEAHRRAAEAEAADYAETVVREVLDPLRGVLGGGGGATGGGAQEDGATGDGTQEGRTQEDLPDRDDGGGRPGAGALVEVLQWAETGVRARLEALDATREVLIERRGAGAWALLARLTWWRAARAVPVRRVAARHLARVVAPAQTRAFRDGERRRARWLDGMERTWARWLEAVTGEGDPRGAAPELDLGLRGLLASLPAAQAGQRREQSFAKLERALARSVSRAGMLGGGAEGGGTGEGAGVPAAGPSGWQEAARQAREWDRRAGESCARLELCARLIEVRAATETIRAEILGRWAEAGGAVDGTLDEMGGVLAGAREKVGSADSGVDRASSADLAGALRVQEASVAEELAEVEDRLDEPAAVGGTLTRAVREVEAGLDVLAARMPEFLVLHPVPRSERSVRSPGLPGRPLRLAEAVRAQLGPAASGRVADAAGRVAEAMGRVHAIVAQLREVASYGFEAAGEELEEGGSARSARRVAADGLDRAGRQVEDAREVLAAAMLGARGVVDEEFAAGAAALRRRSTATYRVRRLLEVRAALAEGTRLRFAAWRVRALRTLSGAIAALGAVRRRVLPFRKALGIDAAPGVEKDAANRARIRDARICEDDVRAGLPLLYQRLFDTDPVDDPRLLAGRESALETVDDSWRRWQGRRRGSLMVVAAPGAGVTSFLNAATARLGGGAPAARWTLADRPSDEAGLAELGAAWLGIRGADDPDALGRQLRRLQREPSGATTGPGLPRAVIVEGLERLHLRAPDGGRLFERFLEFAGSTSSHVFWVLSMGASAWQLAARRSPGSVRDLEVVSLQPLGIHDLRQVIRLRHALSGFPLVFAESGTRRGRVAQRARSVAPGGGQLGEPAEAEYFRELHSASLGSVRLAIFHWLRCADFRSVEGSLVVRPMDAPPSLNGLLDVEESFAVKALLDHGALSPEEYGSIGRIPVEAVRHLFHSLLDLELIEAAGAGTERFRVRPIMTGALAEHLRSLNILHLD